ncbi:uncharacterized protein At1g43920, Chloroplastic-like [Lotus japonicus]|uniref:uncharacterized protein At1g43920, Chloroplastic-like n=1 Tax=Lotus japonicus TaxID=34305 RepID=UPI002585F663|nr:uncharacterized protein At1g43920, Chloroplastic-like [Lotus japonicus]
MNPRFSSRSSTSCSAPSLKKCGCGKEVILYRSNSTNNPGKLFWRCPDWKEKGNCGFFQWDIRPVAEDDMEGSSKLNEGLNLRQDMKEMMEKKLARLKEDIDEIVQKAIENFRKDMDDKKDKKIERMKMKLKNEGLKLNVLWFFFGISLVVALSKWF